MRHKITVILPTYNEADNIKELILLISKAINPSEIIVVDDNSPDHTSRGLISILPKGIIKVFVNKPRLGLTKSIEKGIKKSNNNIVAWMDADFSHPPQILTKMYERMKDNDIVIASWLCKNGKDLRKDVTDQIRSKIINKICQILFGASITAYTSGYVMINKKVFQNYNLKGDYGEYFIDLAVYALKRRLRVCEVPFTCVSRSLGVSKTNPNMVTYIIKGLKYLKMIGILLLRRDYNLQLQNHLQT